MTEYMILETITNQGHTYDTHRYMYESNTLTGAKRMASHKCPEGSDVAIYCAGNIMCYTTNKKWVDL